MNWDHDIDLTKRKFSSQLIVQRALERGWRVAGFESNYAIYLIYIPGRSKPIQIFSSTPPTTSLAASKITKDKFITNNLLSEAGLPVPKELLVRPDTATDEELEAFIAEHGTVVAKPLDASHGKGITIGINNLEQLKSSLLEASEEGNGPEVLIQQQVPGIDIRVLCINYEFTDSISRIPAGIEGDGQHTVKELIEITNSSDERGENYTKKLNVIPLGKAKQFLGEDGMSRVPQQGEAVQVIGVSNVGMGGIRHNIKQDIPEWLKEQAVQAAKVLNLPVCGVDFMVQKLPSSDSTQADLKPYVIEVNECPMLTMYDDLHSQKQYDIIDKYLDLLQDIDN